MRALLLAAAAAVLFAAAASAARVSLPFDFGWRWQMGMVNGTRPLCDQSTFKSENNTQCDGLTHSSAGDASAEDCQATCCVDPDCGLWQWKSPAIQGGGCWSGIAAQDKCNHDTTWVGATRPTPAPVPKAPGGAAARDYDDSGWTVVDVPHDFIINQTYTPNDSGIGHSYLPRNVSWYRKHFDVPAEWKGKAIWLYFEGVFRFAYTYINGEFIGRHGSGYTSFSIRLDNATNMTYGEGSNNVISMFVDGSSGSGWWYEGAGIYRHVYLVATDMLHIEQNGLGSYSNVTGAIASRDAPSQGHTADASVTVRLTVLNQGASTAKGTARATLRDADGKTVASGHAAEMTLPANHGTDISFSIKVSNAELWSIPRPYLYELTTEVVDANNMVLDNFTTSIGIHKDRWDPNQGLFINDKHVKVRGFCDHNDFEGVGMAVADRINLFRAQSVRGLGGNGWRMSHNPPIPTLLDILDRVGVVVMDENRLFANVTSYVEAMGDLVRRDRNHASIIIWSFCNEAGCEGSQEDGAPRFREITYEIDGSRPVLANMFSFGDELSNLTDVQGFSHRSGSDFDMFHAAFPKRPSFGSECCSCTTMRDEDTGNATDFTLSNYNGPCVESQTNWTNGRDFVVGSMVWTAMDYYGEPSFSGWPHKSSSFGSYDLSGFSKAAAYWYRSWWLDAIPQSQDDRPPVGRVPQTHIVQHWDHSKAQGDFLTVAGCTADAEAQNFTMTSGGALLAGSFGLCVDGSCTNASGCYPLPLVKCDGTQGQKFSYDAGRKALISAATGKCLDVYADQGPNVGLYGCAGSPQQQWQVDSRSGFISSNVSGAGFTQCLTDGARSTTLNVYSSGASVDFYVNGKKRGNATVPYYSDISVSLPYEAGSVTAISRDAKGAALSNHTRYTPGAAVAIRLSLDAPTPATGTGRALYLDGQDVALVRAEVIDSNGQVVPGAAHNISFRVTGGPGRVIAVGNGDPRCHEPNHASWRSAFHGLARAIVQATQRATGPPAERALLARIDRDGGRLTHIVQGQAAAPDAVTLTASADGLKGAALSIPTSVDPADSVLASAAAAVAAVNLK